MKNIIYWVPVLGFILNFHLNSTSEVAAKMGWSVKQVNDWATYQIICILATFFCLVTRIL